MDCFEIGLYVVMDLQVHYIDSQSISMSIDRVYVALLQQDILKQ